MASKFQRRHYEAVAATLKRCKPDKDTAWGSNLKLWEEVCLEFVRTFRADNGNFHTYRFYAACGMESDQ